MIHRGLSLKASTKACGQASKIWLVERKVISDVIFGGVAASLLLLLLLCLLEELP